MNSLDKIILDINEFLKKSDFGLLRTSLNPAIHKIPIDFFWRVGQPMISKDEIFNKVKKEIVLFTLKNKDYNFIINDIWIFKEEDKRGINGEKLEGFCLVVALEQTMHIGDF